MKKDMIKGDFHDPDLPKTAWFRSHRHISHIRILQNYVDPTGLNPQP
jgi:hypothetical protein